MVTIGIIGVGAVAVNKQIRGIKESANAIITAICDIDEEKLKTCRG